MKKPSKRLSKAVTVRENNLRKGNLDLPDSGGGLPWTFDLDQVVKTKDDKCALCMKQFRKITDFKIFASTHHNCSKCGISVCDTCSLHKI